jgi:perosamine synthetase
VRRTLLPYGRQWVDEADVAAVARVLRSDWLTTGPAVGSFERAFAAAVGARAAVAVSSGTAALHAAMHAADVGPGDEVIVPAITFVATANAVVFQGARPVFCDVEPDTLLLDVEGAERLITPHTRAIVAVDYAGQPCDYEALGDLAKRRGVTIVADACHALGARTAEGAVGTLALLSAFSLHPVKAITSGEGGVITTDDPALARRMRAFRNHGITTDAREREAAGSPTYDMVTLGNNYRLSDIQCALGESQLRKLPEWVARRQAIARRYDEAFADLPGIRPLAARPRVVHARHCYVVRLEPSRLAADRATVYQALRAEGIGANVHYRPVYLHPFYRDRFGIQAGLCPVAEAAYEELLTLPLFPRMSDEDVADVILAVRKVIEALCV